MEIPKTIRYDFLLILLGIGFMVVPFQFESLDKNPTMSSAFLFLGGLFLVFGLGYMYEEYELERGIKKLLYTKQRYELLKFFAAKRMIPKDFFQDIQDVLRRNR